MGERGRLPPFVNRVWDSLRTTRYAGPTRPATKEAEVPTATQFGLWVLTLGFAFALSFHDIYAERRGWELRPWYARAAPYLQNIGYVAAAALGVVASMFLPLWFAACIVLSGCAAGLLMTFVLKARVQTIAPPGLAVSALASALYVLL